MHPVCRVRSDNLKAEIKSAALTLLIKGYIFLSLLLANESCHFASYCSLVVDVSQYAVFIPKGCLVRCFTCSLNCICGVHAWVGFVCRIVYALLQ